MYTTFMNQNANAFNLNLNDKFNNESKSQIINFNQQKFNNIMNNGKYNNNNHDFNYNKNNNNNNVNYKNFNIYNYNDNFYNNNNLNINKSFNNNNNNNFNNNNNNNFNNNNNNNSNMMNMLNFLNTTWNMFRMFNNQKNVNHSATIQVINNNSNDFDSDKLRKVIKPTVIDINPKYQGVKINIFFQNSSGTKVNVLSPSDITVKDLLLNYVKKIGLGENVIDSVIYFLFSGAKLKKDDERKIYELGMMNGAIIIVIDRNAVTGA